MNITSPSLYGTTLLRLALGAVMLAHAALKYFIFTLPGTAAFFAQHGFPAWSAYPVFGFELVGGLMLILGWYTRWVALALVPIMLGALSVHWTNGWMFTAPNGGWEFPAFLIAALFAQAALGDGAAVRFPSHRPAASDSAVVRSRRPVAPGQRS